MGKRIRYVGLCGCSLLVASQRGEFLGVARESFTSTCRKGNIHYISDDIMQRLGRSHQGLPMLNFPTPDGHGRIVVVDELFITPDDDCLYIPKKVIDDLVEHDALKIDTLSYMKGNRDAVHKTKNQG